MDRWAKSQAFERSWRNQQLLYKPVTTLHKAGGATEEIAYSQSVVVAKLSRKPGRAVVTLRGIDFAALDQVFPFETFAVKDWPNLFVGDVGRRVTQGVGNVRKLPLCLIDTDGATFWTYAGPKVIGAAGTLETVYRGTQRYEGAIVDPSEYTTGVATAPSGYKVVTVTFAKEQAQFGSGQPFILEADWSLPGSRWAPDELARILSAYGISTGASFATAAAYDAGIGLGVDAAYGDEGRTGRAIVADLCAAARGWLSRSSGGTWEIVQDVPSASTAEFDAALDQIEMDAYGEGDIPATVSLSCRPKASLSEVWSEPLTRDVGGASGERQLHNPYLDYPSGDILISYWQKRLATLHVARGTIHATQLMGGAHVTVTAPLLYGGAKEFILTGVGRPADSNDVTLREYDASIHVYEPGALPADATNGYSPDYSFTKPAAPTGLAVVSQGAHVAADGKMTSYALIRATPPALNWERLMVLASNDDTGEEYQAQLILNVGNYEAVVTGMHPGVNHHVIAWAVNANSVDGVATAPLPFVTASFSTSPAVPTALAYISGGTVTAADGKISAYALIRATPPALYFKRLMAQVIDVGSGAFVQQQLRLNGANYEATFAGLRPNQPHQVIAWAVNASSDDGGVAAPVNFTSATSSAVPSTPTVIDGQTHSFQIDYSWNVSTTTGAPIKEYVFEIAAGGGGWGEKFRGRATGYSAKALANGTSYQGRVKAIDTLGNESAYGFSGHTTVVPKIDDNAITPGGVSAPSIASAAVGAAKVNWAYTINNYAGLANGGTVGIGTQGVGLLPWVELTGGGNSTGVNIVGTPSGAGGHSLGAKNNTGATIGLTVKDPALL